jgi:hypothetical protein
MNPYLVQVPIFVPLPVLLQAQATYLNMLQNSQQLARPSDSQKQLEVPADSCLDKLEKKGVSAYSIISKAPEQIEKDLDEEERRQKEKEMEKEKEKEKEKEVVAASVRKSKKVAKPWHLASHKFFRNAIFKQIFDILHEPQLAVVLNRLNSVGCDVKKFALAIESKLYYNAERLEEYLEFTTLKKRVCEEIKKTKKVYI